MNMFSNNVKAILFGAGGVGAQALEYFGADNVECFIDNNKHRAGTMLCGKIVRSFDDLIKTYSNKQEYRIYITTDTYFNEIAEQLNSYNVENYSFFHDYIPGYYEVKKLIDESITDSTNIIAVVGTSNVTELFVYALAEIKPSIMIDIFDYHNSRKIGRKYFGYTVKDAEMLIEKNSTYDMIIFTITEERTYGKTGITHNFDSVVLDAREAIRYSSEEYLLKKGEYKKIDPKKILSSTRLDIIPRYFLAKMIINKEDNSEIKSLYARIILFVSDAYEKVGVYSERAKSGVEEHIQAFQKVVNDMINVGFRKNNYIPIANGRMYDGAHRLAAALALNEEVWIRTIQNKSAAYDYKWLDEKKFNNKDKLMILRGFADLYHMCNIFVIYYPAFEQYDYIESLIEQHMTIVGRVELDFTDNFYAFKNLMNDIYKTYETSIKIAEKIRDLMMFPMIIKVVLVSDEGFENQNIYAWSTHIKQKVRDQLAFDIPPEAYCTIHSADCIEEFEELKRIVLSNNNICQLKRRVNTEYRKEFINRLCELKKTCIERKINLEDICVVSSGVMEVMGIRDANDFDIILSSSARIELDISDSMQLTNDIEIISSSSIRDSKGEIINDDLIISDSEKHFCFYGVKFCNIEYVKNSKKYSFSERKKDKQDIRLIECFEDYSRYSSEDSLLREQMRIRYK